MATADANGENWKLDKNCRQVIQADIKDMMLNIFNAGERTVSIIGAATNDLFDKMGQTFSDIANGIKNATKDAIDQIKHDAKCKIIFNQLNLVYEIHTYFFNYLFYKLQLWL